jgi:hypothetical protein
MSQNEEKRPTTRNPHEPPAAEECSYLDWGKGPECSYTRPDCPDEWRGLSGAGPTDEEAYADFAKRIRALAPNCSSMRFLLQSERCGVSVEPKIPYSELGALAKAHPGPAQVLEIAVKLSTGQTMTIKPVQEGTKFSWSQGATKEARAKVYETYYRMTKEEAATRAEEDLRAMLDGKSDELREARREQGEGQPVGCSFSDWTPGSKEVETWSFWRSADGLWSFGRKTEASFTPKGCELKDELTGTWDEAEKRFAELSRGA